MAGRCVVTTRYFYHNFSHYFVYNRKEHSGWRGPDTLLTEIRYLLILIEEFEVDLDTLRARARARVCVCVCVCVSNGLGQTSYASHTGGDGR